MTSTRPTSARSLDLRPSSRPPEPEPEAASRPAHSCVAMTTPAASTRRPKTGASDVFPMSPASRNAPQVRRGAEEATPEFNHLQPGDAGSRSETQEQAPEIQNLESNWRSTTEEGRPLQGLEDRLSPESRAGLNLEANPGPRGQKSADAVVTGEKEKKKEEVKTRGVKKQSLR